MTSLGKKRLLHRWMVSLGIYYAKMLETREDGFYVFDLLDGIKTSHAGFSYGPTQDIAIAFHIESSEKQAWSAQPMSMLDNGALAFVSTCLDRQASWKTMYGPMFFSSDAHTRTAIDIANFSWEKLAIDLDLAGEMAVWTV